MQQVLNKDIFTCPTQPLLAESPLVVCADNAALDAEVESELASIAEDDRVLITNHEVFGYFATDGGGRIWPVTPTRVLDTRDGTGIPNPRQVGPGRPLQLALAGVEGIAEEATAVILNVAATNISARSFISVYPAGDEHPGTANLNIKPDRNIANLVICSLGDDGALTFDNRIANCDIIADVFGYVV